MTEAELALVPVIPDIPDNGSVSIVFLENFYFTLLASIPYIPDIPDNGSVSIVFLENFYLTLLASIPYIPDPLICGSDGGGSGDGGGSDGSCEDPRPETGMLYPRG